MTTLVTATQLADLRRMVAEPTTATYSDATLTAIIEKYPHLDEQGEDPFTLSSATPPVHVANAEWMPTYDLNAAAADVWEEKAGAVAVLYDFSADGGNYSRGQMYQSLMAQARYYRSKRTPTTMRMVKWPEEPDQSQQLWIGNLAEPRDPTIYH
jgi:hypothetical protein